jgi:hypothetical protein
MGLLSPFLLALGVAAAVPLLLHLLQRQQGRRFVFPAIRYLRRAEQESARRIRVRQLLLMLVRIAAVLLIALAAARPYLRAGGAGHAPTAVVIILDNSPSTSAIDGERRVLDELKARALDVLAVAGPEDRFWLLRPGTPGEPALAGGADATALRVRETEPGGAPADLPAALAHARALLGAGADGRAAEIHLLTDLQASSLPAAAPAGAAAPPLIVWHPGGRPPPNRAVAAVEVGGGFAPLAGERTSVTARIEGDDADVNVRLYLEDRLVAATTAQTGATAVLTLPAQPPGVVAGRVQIDPDALRLDDTRFFAAHVLPPPLVALHGEQPFIDDALAVLADAGRVRRAGAGSADVAIMPAGVGLDAAPADGAVVVLPPADPVQLAATNRRLAAAGIPWRFAAPVPGEARFATPPAADPLLRALEPVRLRQVYPLLPQDATAADSVLLRLSDGSAWAARGARRTGGLYVLLASPLTDAASTLPTSAAMLPLLDRVTGAWSTAEPPRTEAVPGADVPLPAGATAVTRPDGISETVHGSDYRLGIEPGVYRVLRGDSVVAAYAVNTAGDTHDLTRLDRRALAERLPGWELHAGSDAAAFRRAVFRERLGRELVRPLLAALLLLLLLESLIAAAGRRRTAAPASAPAASTATSARAAPERS